MGYAGISSFVIVFAVFPIFLSVWKEANLPRKLIPGCIFASVCSFSCGFFPGAAFTINMLPISYLNTDPAAEPFIGIVAGVVTMILVLFWKNIKNKQNTINTGLFNSVSPVVNTAAVTAFGTVVQSTADFAATTAALMNLNFHLLISYCIMACVVSGLCGSSTGATGIMLSSLAPKYISMGVSASVIYRIGCAAALSFDSLPHNGLVVTMLTYCGVSHKKGYKTIFVTTVLLNFIGAVLAMLMACVMYPI